MNKFHPTDEAKCHEQSAAGVQRRSSRATGSPGAPERALSPGFPTLTLTVLFPSLCPLSMPVLFCVNIFYIVYICKHLSYDDYIKSMDLQRTSSDVA